MRPTAKDCQIRPAPRQHGTRGWQDLLVTERPTPYLTIDVDILDANLRDMQQYCDERGVALRPHAKTHKMIEIADRQLEFGARGLTVATIGEAECFAEAGVTDIFIGYPVVTATPERLRALASRCLLTIGVDSPEAIARLADIGGLRALVEIESGLRRTGVEPAAAGELATRAAAAGLIVDGVFTFPGHSYVPGGAAHAATDEANALAEAAESLRAAGFRCEVVSGGSTPSARHSDAAVITETRPGVYALNDAQQVALATVTADQVAVAIRTTVISAPTTDRFVLDAGAKTIAADRPAYVTGHGSLPEFPGAVIDRIWEHHAVVDATHASSRPRIGDVVELVPNHICTAINLADEVIVVQGGAEVDRWRVAARGRNG